MSRTSGYLCNLTCDNQFRRDRFARTQQSSECTLTWEPASEIHTSTQLGLVDDPSFPHLIARKRGDIDAERIDELELGNCFDSCKATVSSVAGGEVNVVLSDEGCVLVGTANVDNRMAEVWATLVSSGPDFGCDAPHRAHIVLEAVLDRRAEPERDVCVRGIDNLDDIILWSSTLPEGTLRSKLARVYDVLLYAARDRPAYNLADEAPVTWQSLAGYTPDGQPIFESGVIYPGQDGYESFL
ncbi:hypothetical protein IQ06DRAFT_354397 [Phaeosphaeriaceae sp. SRC1lsM3a]|nr:hypothetical protein IQ06DRAFT_354397 [Stagonospora sp. SRC1lsM3a]